MKNELDSKFVLRVFDKIRQEGEETEGKHRLEGVVAYTDFDGYTLYINDAKVAKERLSSSTILLCKPEKWMSVISMRSG